MLAEAGKDATVQFDEIFHSASAMALLPTYAIGTVEVGSMAALGCSSRARAAQGKTEADYPAPLTRWVLVPQPAGLLT